MPRLEVVAQAAQDQAKWVVAWPSVQTIHHNL
jgi:hypothetical protein